MVQVGAQAASEAARFPQRAAVGLQERLNRRGRTSHLQTSRGTAERRHLWWRGGGGGGERRRESRRRRERREGGCRGEETGRRREERLKETW